MGGVFAKDDSPQNSLPVSKLEAKMVEEMQKRASHGTFMRSFNTIILKFRKIDESLRKCQTIFEEFGKLFCLQL
jgi:calcium-binding protein CML